VLTAAQIQVYVVWIVSKF